MMCNRVLPGVALLLAALPLTAASSAQRSNPGPAALTNPVEATPESIRRGRQAYVRACRHCHGENARGDGPLAPADPRPPNLADETWIFGSTDGEIFAVIANGAGAGSPMKGFRSAMPAREIWDIVNYLRSIGKPTDAGG